MALIGPGWLEADAQGRRKIDSQEDWVRREIREALERGIPVLPVLGSGARMPAAKDLPADLERFARLQALSMADMRFYPLLSDSLAQAGIRGVDAAGGEQPASRVVLAGSLLKRQAERLQIRAKELIREGQTGRALEELNEGTELMMALLDFVPGEQELDVQLSYIYGALAQEFDRTSQPEMASRYRDLQLGILKRVKDDLSAFDYLTGNAASVIEEKERCTPNAASSTRRSSVTARPWRSNRRINTRGTTCSPRTTVWHGRAASLWTRCGWRCKRPGNSAPGRNRAHRSRVWDSSTWTL